MKTLTKKITTSKRDRRKLRIRRTLSGTEERPRISVFRSSKHTYAQIISDETLRTIASASTLDEDVQKTIESLKAKAKEEGGKASTKSVLAARAVGLVLAKRGQGSKVNSVVFDRNGFLYSGRIQAVADGAREGGLKF